VKLKPPLSSSQKFLPSLLKAIFCILQSPKIAGRFPGSDESQLAGELKGKKANLTAKQIEG